MAAPAPYIPPRQVDTDVWMQNFSTLISASPTTYGLLASAATIIATFVGAFHISLAIALTPSPRTPASIAQKDSDLASALVICRGYAIQVRNNTGVTNADKAALGLTIPTLTPTPIPTPNTQPVLAIIGATPLQFTIKYSDTATPLSKAKPFGVSHLEIHAVTSATVISNQDVIPYLADYTKGPFPLNWQPADVGKVGYICGRWKTRRGGTHQAPALIGPWSSIISMVVVG